MKSSFGHCVEWEYNFYDDGGGEWTESDPRFSAGDICVGDSGAKLEDEDGGLEYSDFIILSSTIGSEEVEVGVLVLPPLMRSEDEDELLRVCVRKWRVIMSLRQAEYGHCGHLYGFSPVWVLWWVLKWSDLCISQKYNNEHHDAINQKS